MFVAKAGFEPTISAYETDVIDRFHYLAIFVGTPRFELGLREPKSLVLPLHHVPITMI